MRRTLVYVFLVVAAIGLMSALNVTLTEGPTSGTSLVGKMWAKFAPAFIAAFLLIPIVVIDCIRLSNRFAGPMLRLRRAMRDAADGKPVTPIKFRDGDFWCSFAEDFNRLIASREANASSGSRGPQQEEPEDEQYSEPEMAALNV